MFTDRSYFSVPVVGVTFDDRQHTISLMRVGDKLVLMREPYNPFDPNAIAVETLSGEQVGYLSRPMAAGTRDLFPEEKFRIIQLTSQ